MMRRAQALLAKLAKQVASRIRGGRYWRMRDEEPEDPYRDSLASYSAPSRHAEEPPYASLRQ